MGNNRRVEPVTTLLVLSIRDTSRDDGYAFECKAVRLVHVAPARSTPLGSQRAGLFRCNPRIEPRNPIYRYSVVVFSEDMPVLFSSRRCVAHDRPATSFVSVPLFQRHLKPQLSTERPCSQVVTIRLEHHFFHQHQHSESLVFKQLWIRKRGFRENDCRLVMIGQWLGFSGTVGKIQVNWEDGAWARGNFGSVYTGTRHETGESVVVKLAPSVDRLARSLLEVERYMNQKLTASDDILMTPRRWARYVGDVDIPAMDAPEDVVEKNAPFALVWTKEGTGETLEDYLSGRPRSALSAALGTNDGYGHRASLCCASFRVVVGELLRALVQLQDCGIMHRDVKPRNIVVVPDSNDGAPLKLIDFGSACDWRSLLKRGFDPERATCDPTYAAPETFLSPIRPDRFDVFSVALIGLRVLIPALRGEERLRECLSLWRSKYRWNVQEWVAEIAKAESSQTNEHLFCEQEDLGAQLKRLQEDTALLGLLSAMLRETPMTRISAERALSLYDF